MPRGIVSPQIVDLPAGPRSMKGAPAARAFSTPPWQCATTGGGNSPLHLGMFFAVRLAAALKAYHGEGDHAPDASQTQVQKAVYIVDTIVNVWVT